MEVPENAINVTAYWTWMGTDGIARTRVKPGFEITLEHAMENTAAVTSLFKDKKFPLLIDSRPIGSMTRDARNYFSMNGRETKLNSMAIVIKSPLSRVIGNFFLGMNKPAVPTRLFDDENDAIEWLHEYL